MNRIKFYFLSIVLCYLPVSVMAWGQTGHRVIGAIAETYLTRKAKAAIKEILGNESMAMASTWADFIRSDSNFNYLSSWHYVNVKQGLAKDEFTNYLKNDTIVDAYTKIDFLVNELKNKQLEADKKVMYLRLLIHIVGDVHQPMHAGQLEDLGGNRIKVLWFGEPANLHNVWDEKIVESQKLSYTEYCNAINYTTKKQRLEWQSQSPSEWLYESYQIAGQLYSEIKQPDQKLSFRYTFDHLDTVNERLLKAGVRLAGLLNEVFG